MVIPEGMARIRGGFRIGPPRQTEHPPLILLPGIEGDGRGFFRQGPLSARRAVCALDLPAAPKTLSALSHALLETIDAQRFCLFGVSLGGLVGWRMSQLAPHRVCAIVTMGTLPGPGFRSIGFRLQARMIQHAPKALFSQLYRRRIRRRMVEEGLDEPTIALLTGRLPDKAALLRRLSMIRLWEIDGPPSVPAMWLRGTFDREAPWTTAQASALLPNAIVDTVPGGHRAHLTHPTHLHGVIEHFLRPVR
ncbi:MAG: alpha/beta hydrolase [Myxococcota bacterium]